jgi:hypothetical protein
VVGSIQQAGDGRVSGARPVDGTASAGIGFLHARKWAWWFAVLFTVDGCGDLISFFITGELLKSASGVAVCSVFLVRTQPQ